MKIVIKCADGGVEIMTLDQNSIERRGVKATMRMALGEWKAYYPGRYVSHRKMPDASIPSLGSALREFRTAWTDVTPDHVIDIDMTKARDIHLSRIRYKRNEFLAELDVHAIKVQDIGDEEKLAQIRARKQELRDLPQTILPSIESAETVEALLAVKPF